jgi:hypothetical protein
MSPLRQRSKKDPRYLEDITYSIATKADTQGDLFSSNNLFMGKYDENKMMAKLKRVGIIDILRTKGYRELVVSVIRQDDYTSRLYVNFDSHEKETRLVELIVREGFYKPRVDFIPAYDFSTGLSMLLIEWVALQDPKASFTPEKPRLPGQQYPGIGGLKNMQELFYHLCKSSGKDAIVDVPEYFHSAAIYSRMYTEIYDRMYAFFSPVDTGIMQAMLRDLTDRPLADTSFAVAFDCLLDARTGASVKWKTSEQIYPISRKLKKYVEDDQYKEIVMKTMEEHSYAIDWDRFEQIKAHGLMDEI